MSVLIKNGYVVTMNATRETFDGGYVVIGADGLIKDVGAAGNEPAEAFEKIIDARQTIVLPGLINLHQHHWYSLFKGLAGGMLLEDWVMELLLPCAHRLSADDLRAAAYFSAMEMLRTGTTCCLNHSVTNTMAEEVAATIEPMAEMGFRQVFAKDFRCRTDANPDHPHTVEEELAFATQIVGKWDGSLGGLVKMALVVESNAHWVLAGMSTEKLIEAGYQLAKSHGLQITNHTSGGTFSLEKGYLHAMRKTGRTDVKHLMQLGVLDEHWLLIHGINLSDTDIALMKEAGCHAVYTPTSEAIRGGGVGPWVKLYQAGVNCALGTDGPMVDYTIDMVEQIKACSVIQNTANLNPTAMSIERSLEMATINGAKALGLDDKIGSLEPGKQADVVIFDMSELYFQVAHKPISNFVCSGRGADARTVIVNGKTVYDDGRFMNGPEPDEVVVEATRRGHEIALKTGVNTNAHFNWPTMAAAGSRP